VAKNNKTRFFFVLYCDKTWGFDQSEHAQGPIYIIKFLKWCWDALRPPYTKAAFQPSAYRLQYSIEKHVVGLGNLDASSSKTSSLMSFLVFMQFNLDVYICMVSGLNCQCVQDLTA